MSCLLRVFLPCFALGLLSPPPASAAQFGFRQEVSARATVQFLGAASGKYALLADNGAVFEPTNLKRIYQVDGTRVRFTAKLMVRPAPQIAGARVVRITSIRSLPASSIRTPPAGYRGIPTRP